MKLFETEISNLLPVDGIAEYYTGIINQNQANHYFKQLLITIAWQHDEINIFGKKFITKRMAAWYGDSPFNYTYSNTTKTALPWIPLLLELKEMAEANAGVTFNSCLLNLYQNGTEGMAWHSDDEKELGKDTVIASISLGAGRRFIFRHKVSGQKVETLLENGSLLIMKGSTQSHWQHSIPKMLRVRETRINLTFRTIII